jgi:hypothetical protein
MATSRRAAGLGLLAYGIGTLAAFMAIGSPGGDYENSGIAEYLSGGHRITAFALAYAGGLAALGLLPFAHRMRQELGGLGRTVWGLGVAAVATAVTGWFVVGGVAVAATEGGSAVTRGVAHPVVYVFTEIGNLVAVCGPAFLVGIVAVLLAARGPLPAPLRAVSAVAGLCRIVAPLFFPMFVYFLGVLVLAVWCLVARAPRRAPAPAQTQTQLV